MGFVTLTADRSRHGKRTGGRSKDAREVVVGESRNLCGGVDGTRVMVEEEDERDMEGGRMGGMVIETIVAVVVKSV